MKSIKHEYLKREDWAPDVRKAVNDLIDAYGKNGPKHQDSEYAVFDFDNTTAIFDVEHQLCNYQLETMCFAMTPDQLAEAMAACAGLQDGTLDKDLYCYAEKYGHFTYNDWILDLQNAYSYLWKTYGPFTGRPLSKEQQSLCRQDPWWLEFAAKMRAYYDLVGYVETSDVCGRCPLYWFTGMTEQQVYDIAYESHLEGAKRETRKVTWTSPDPGLISSKVGQVSISFMDGVSTTENLKELWQALSENGIDVWVVSASGTRQVQAAIDAWGLSPWCKGMMAMNVVVGDDGKYIPEYDFAGHFFLPDPQENSLCGWMPDPDPRALPLDAVPHDHGKKTVIDEGLVTKYGCGPIAGFMDSSGDFNFCTEYDSTRLVICFNRANRSVLDIGSLVAEVAMYERDDLGYDLEKAAAAGDTLYVLQGRDERGLRCLRADNTTIRFDQNEANLFHDEQNMAVLQYIRDHRLTVKQAMDLFAVDIPKESPDNLLGFRYGWLKYYSGYKNSH